MQKHLLSTALLLGIITSSCSSETNSEKNETDYSQPSNGSENSASDTTGNTSTNNTAYDTSELIKQYTCNSETHIYSQVTVDSDDICQSLAEVEGLFFERFGSVPVPDDYNNNRDLYIYKDRSNYLAKDFNTSSYGKYIEQEPSDPQSNGEIYSYLLDNGNVKNQSHEYIHYLDGRFNKYGDYHATELAAWWTEGLAEYLQHLHWGVASSFIKKSISDYGSDFTLNTIFSLTKDDYKTDYFDLVYDGGNVALCYFLQEEPAALKTLLSHSRSGNWSAWSSELDNLAAIYGDDFDIFVNELSTDEKVCHLNISNTGKI